MYAVLHPSNFFAQAAAHERPELRKKPFVVLDGEPPTEKVFAVNHAARSQGVEIGMTRLQAEAFPGVTALRRVIGQEHKAHATLHHVACMFSPRIESVEERPGTYALDIRGMDLLYGNAAELANKLRRSVMTAGFLANIAVAENFHAAVSLARGRTGVSVVPSGCEAHAIGELPVTALHLAPEHEATFAAWGIRTCAELAALSETDVIARLGQAGKKLHSLARGTWPHLMFPIEPELRSRSGGANGTGLSGRGVGTSAVSALPHDDGVAGACSREGTGHRRAPGRCCVSTAAHNMSAPFVLHCRCRIRRHCSSSSNSIWRRILRVQGLWVWNCTRNQQLRIGRSMASFFRKRRSQDSSK